MGIAASSSNTRASRHPPHGSQVPRLLQWCNCRRKLIHLITDVESTQTDIRMRRNLGGPSPKSGLPRCCPRPTWNCTSDWTPVTSILIQPESCAAYTSIKAVLFSTISDRSDPPTSVKTSQTVASHPHLQLLHSLADRDHLIVFFFLRGISA